MERLTQYFEVGSYTEKQNIIDVSDKLPLFENGVIMGKAIDRLAEFEDFMEENDIYTLEQLKNTVNIKESTLDKLSKINIWLMRKYGDKLYKEFGISKDNTEIETFIKLDQVFDKIYEEMNKEMPLMWYKYGFFTNINGK